MKELALHIMDIMQNSITAESSIISVGVKAFDLDGLVTITVADNGCGMDEETLKRATDPFHTSRATRLVGLGLPMFKEAALQTGGDFKLESEQGVGTLLTASFVNDSVDRQPLGNLGNVFFLTMLSHQDLNLKLELSSYMGTFSFDSKLFSEGLLNRGSNQMDAAFRAETFINEQVDFLFKDTLPELGGGLGDLKRNCQADPGTAAL